MTTGCPCTVASADVATASATAQDAQGAPGAAEVVAAAAEGAPAAQGAPEQAQGALARDLRLARRQRGQQADLGGRLRLQHSLRAPDGGGRLQPQQRLQALGGPRLGRVRRLWRRARGRLLLQQLLRGRERLLLHQLQPSLTIPFAHIQKLLRDWHGPFTLPVPDVQVGAMLEQGLHSSGDGLTGRSVIGQHPMSGGIAQQHIEGRVLLLVLGERVRVRA
mmetsp:Transcript_47917/g.137540  ORF Transcript_47917/g.137540 Transcript_47917/m.137540 type:complete len:220 (+) Transcript_47917:248-907(+)